MQFVCSDCPLGTYNFQFDKKNADQKCNEALMEGSVALLAHTNHLYTKDGYWRYHPHSEILIECPFGSEACNGTYGSGNEVCTEGHVGPLCAVCDNPADSVEFYYDSDGARCEACGPGGSPYVVSVAAFAAVLVALLLGYLALGTAWLSDFVKPKQLLAAENRVVALVDTGIVVVNAATGTLQLLPRKDVAAAPSACEMLCGWFQSGAEVTPEVESDDDDIGPGADSGAAASRHHLRRHSSGAGGGLLRGESGRSLAERRNSATPARRSLHRAGSHVGSHQQPLQRRSSGVAAEGVSSPGTAAVDTGSHKHQIYRAVEQERKELSGDGLMEYMEYLGAPLAEGGQSEPAESTSFIDSVVAKFKILVSSAQVQF